MGFPIRNESEDVLASRGSSDGAGSFLAPCSRWIAVAGGFGYAPWAPGTAGSLAGVLVFLSILWLADRSPRLLAAGPGSVALLLVGYGVLVVGLCGLGVWAAGQAERAFDRKDDGRIVIDEVAGQLVTLWPLPLFLAPAGGSGIFSSPGAGVVTGFVLFRVFDIWKPGAVRWAERRFEGGLGVMADDVVAGVYAAVTLVVVALLGSLLWGPVGGGA
jgi:phosphatidylglycerophosphatase A